MFLRPAVRRICRLDSSISHLNSIYSHWCTYTPHCSLRDGSNARVRNKLACLHEDCVILVPNPPQCLTKLTAVVEVSTCGKAAFVCSSIGDLPQDHRVGYLQHFVKFCRAEVMSLVSLQLRDASQHNALNQEVDLVQVLPCQAPCLLSRILGLVGTSYCLKARPFLCPTTRAKGQDRS